MSKMLYKYELYNCVNCAEVYDYTSTAYWALPTGSRPRGRPRTHWRDYISHLACEPQSPPGGAGECYWEEEHLPAWPGAPATRPRITG